MPAASERTVSAAARNGSATPIDGTLRDDRALHPRSIILSIYGEYARDVGGWLSVASLITMLNVVDVDESAIRSSISRLKRRGLLEPLSVEGVRGYSLSPMGRTLLVEGDKQIFGRRRAERDDGWLLVVFSVPEEQRAERHRLRTCLTALGFGSVAAGIWIAPANRLDLVRDSLGREGLDRFVDIFTAHYEAFGEPAARCWQWWDLDAMAAMFADFVTEQLPALRAWRRLASIDPGPRPFHTYLLALTKWRRLPYRDPGLPTELLPADWPGFAAEEVFFQLRDLLAAPARAWVESLTTVRSAS
jgi:phenylacetic acid degradation operon negative regulatory protein